MKFRLGIWGWWQGKNLGDQWIKETLKMYFPNASFLPTNSKIKDVDFLICGGGGLFFSEIPYSWKKISKSIPFGILGLGSEFEYEDDFSKLFQKRAKFFYVRDKHTLRCMHLDAIPRSYDLTFANPVQISNDSINAHRHCLFVWRTPSEYMIGSQQWRNYQRPNYNFEDWKKTIDNNFESVKYNDFETFDSNIGAVIDGCDFVVSGRYHGIVAAIQRGVPCIGIDLCPKIRALMEEVGIDEYCLKLDEVNKLDYLIKKAQDDAQIIREKELAFREKANKTILQHICNAKLEISKVMHPQKFLYYGKYYFGKNDVVSVMGDSLKRICKAKVIEIKNKKIKKDKRVSSIITTKNGEINVLKDFRLALDCFFYRPDAIILNSGGLCFDRFTDKLLRRLGITKICIELSDPDVYPYNGNVYSNQFDIFYTNASYTISNQNPNAKLLGFGASEKHHHYMPDVEKKYDVVIVGGCRPDRIPIVDELKKHFNVGVYGPGWKDGLGPVFGIEQVKAINSGKIYLSFSKTNAGFNNVKVGLFEAIACKSFVITEYMDELKLYFKINKEIVTYDDIMDLVSKIDYYLKHDDERKAIAENCFQKFLNSHTYEKRLNQVIDDYYIMKGLKYE